MNLVQTLHPILSFGPMYRMAMNLFGNLDARKSYVDLYVRPKKGDRVVDLGCGPCEILECLPAVDYVGVDFEPHYIADAQKRFGERGNFICADIADLKPGIFPPADIILVTGVIHHLDDEVARHMLTVARSLLKETGRLVSLDGCFLESGQHPFDTWMLSNDRGKFVRKRPEYERLAGEVFPHVKSSVHSNLLRFPYTHIIMECGLSPIF